MLHVLLTILKILLFAILIILGLAIALLLLILLAPIHYRADVKYKGKAKVFAKIRYLIVTVRISFDQETKALDKDIRVLGFIRLKGRKKSPPEELDPEAEIEKHGKSYDEFEGADDDLPEIDVQETENEAQTKTEDQTQLHPTAQTETEGQTEIPGDSPWVNTENKTMEEDNPDAIPLIDFKVDYGEPEEPVVSDDSSELIELPPDIEEEKSREETVGFVAKIIAKLMDIAGKITSKLGSILEKIFDKVDEVSDKVDAKVDDIDAKIVRADKTIRRFEKFWELKCTEKTKAYLAKYLKTFFRHIAPRKAKGYAEYGFDDAAKTGEITGYLSLLPCMYQRKLYIYPNFSDKVMDIDVRVKGFIVLGYLLRFVFSINLWKTIMAARKIKPAEPAQAKPVQHKHSPA